MVERSLITSMVYPNHSHASDSVSTAATTSTTSTTDDRDPYDTTSFQGASAHHGAKENFLVRVVIEILVTYRINRFELELALLGSLRYGEATLLSKSVTGFDTTITLVPTTKGVEGSWRTSSGRHITWASSRDTSSTN
jgi:hypothetical protein